MHPAVLVLRHSQVIRLSGTYGFGDLAVRVDHAPVTVEIENPGPSRDLVIELQWADPGTRQGPTSLSGRRGPVHALRLSINAGSRKTLTATMLVPDMEETSLWATALDPQGGPVARTEIFARLLRPDTRVMVWV